MSAIGRSTVASVIATEGALDPVAGEEVALSAAPRVSSDGGSARRKSGPAIAKAGKPASRPYRIESPVSAPSRSIATSGPGCGATRPWLADRPATSGNASVSSGRPEVAASPTTTGKRRTSPTLKKTGRPMTKPTVATAHGSQRSPTAATAARATTEAPPDSASSAPTNVPSPMTTAMNPSVLPTPC